MLCLPLSQLLAHLDTAVKQEPQALEHAVVDKAYMAQLVEVQQMRGASGGVEFHKLLTKGVEEPSDKDKGWNQDIQLLLTLLTFLCYSTLCTFL